MKVWSMGVGWRYLVRCGCGSGLLSRHPSASTCWTCRSARKRKAAMRALDERRKARRENRK